MMKATAAPLWSTAGARLVELAGRARIHDLCDALNAVAIGVELIAHAETQGEDAPRLTRARVLRREVASAGSEAAALQTLVAEAAAPQLGTLPEVVRWALRVTRPVARRRSVALDVSPSPDEVDPVVVPVGTSIALGLVLAEACLVSPRGGRCLVTLSEDPPVITVSADVAATKDGGHVSAAADVLRDVLEGSRSDGAATWRRRASVNLSLHSASAG